MDDARSAPAEGQGKHANRAELRYVPALPLDRIVANTGLYLAGSWAGVAIPPATTAPEPFRWVADHVHRRRLIESLPLSMKLVESVPGVVSATGLNVDWLAGAYAWADLLDARCSYNIDDNRPSFYKFILDALRQQATEKRDAFTQVGCVPAWSGAPSPRRKNQRIALRAPEAWEQIEGAPMDDYMRAVLRADAFERFHPNGRWISGVGGAAGVWKIRDGGVPRLHRNKLRQMLVRCYRFSAGQLAAVETVWLFPIDVRLLPAQVPLAIASPFPWLPGRFATGDGRPALPDPLNVSDSCEQLIRDVKDAARRR